MQTASMNTDLRMMISGGDTPGLFKYQLPKSVVEAAATELDAGVAHVHAERSQLAHRVGEESDAQTEVFKFWRRLIHPARDAAIVQPYCQRQSDDTAADNADFHN